jgi:hypothetical protein
VSLGLATRGGGSGGRSGGDPPADDARALYNALVELIHFSASHNINLRGTLGQTAWIAAQGIADKLAE